MVWGSKMTGTRRPAEQDCGGGEQRQSGGPDMNAIYCGCSHPTAIYFHALLRCLQVSAGPVVQSAPGPQDAGIWFAQISGGMETAHQSVRACADEIDGERPPLTGHWSWRKK